jgi:rhodanese-related sulfurtransferase
LPETYREKGYASMKSLKGEVDAWEKAGYAIQPAK